MRCIIDSTTDPYWNLAVEEYLLTVPEEPVFRLWRNAPAIIVGRNQNTPDQINSEYVREQGIAVVRRLSGGGAVFHDLGNINFTFVDAYVPRTDPGEAFARFTRPILDVLHSLGVAAELEGRNDLVIEGRKFSGNAIALYKNRILMHGTLLFSASIRDLSLALQVKARERGRGVASNPRRVCNLSEYLPKGMKTEDFLEVLKRHIAGSPDKQTREQPLDPRECQIIETLCRKKYRTYAWNYGRAPLRGDLRRERFAGGNVEILLQVNNGIMEEVKIYGDYFFLYPTEEIEQALQGCPHNREAIAGRLARFSLDDYFRDIPREGLLDLFI
ncbi:MAG TPA: lipoate--protein ligase [Bacteroidales bacterium]|jgi:lipoate-protein ligase A|nr:lipoate--protein ligase [Bacteroidales bacterium]MCZ2416446.1 lipoate--protein ligase [Burkholderiales bacterium]OQC57653.1 MAG: Lipoate-protein ligase LplJ [Bacteroidetes bacterium ADurb.Bin013]MBV6455323.1 Lipoate-protein ligase LplJ [Bacteroidales bacterium]MCZ2316243.1 lipoate--protein ligase [Bacteroidales bacterium]